MRLREYRRGLVKLRAIYHQETLDTISKLDGRERHEKLGELHGQQAFEEQEYVDQIDQIHSERLTRRAMRLRVPLPTDQDNWSRSNWNGRSSLTDAAFHNLRGAVRKEALEQRASWEWWLKTLGTAVTALTGLGGVVIGILAFMSK
ncbi:hypothetical protein [Bosea lathyri]|uniref:hypothetical protein n=1 Tax=Bosea lathyri TaxID=1036778 RepID=UPI001358BD2F|nr:hypothetical protein [Bosea lathyri]